ncbi:biotinidase [Xyrichtys novacula]|uniref:Biotinidase n=1 Tax=Xyrichtys novacula TaxID=13765 RepID=A0AAV1F3N6_XYRNO|nr:biotinidase [Xyrichtys novacula]
MESSYIAAVYDHNLITNPDPRVPVSRQAALQHMQKNVDIYEVSDGLLVARYHKYNPFPEESFDTPPQPEIITFDTPFAGKFGLLICLDILFYKPTIALVEKLGSDLGFRHDNKNMAGSGIYTPFSSIYHHSKRGDPEEGKLLVARVPVLDPEWSGQRVATEEEKLESESTSSPVTESGFCHSESCSDASSATFTSFMIGDPFTFVLLNEKEGRVKVCNGSFYCHLQYKRISQGDSEELYAFGAFAGLHTLDGDLSLQVCALIRCAGSDPSSCGQGVEEAETKMDL